MKFNKLLISTMAWMLAALLLPCTAGARGVELSLGDAIRLANDSSRELLLSLSILQIIP